MRGAAPRGAAPIPGFRSETARVGNVRLHHWLGGDPNGQPALLWHGFLSNGYAWRNVAPALAAAGLAVLVPDMRGYGGSDKPAGTEGYDACALAGGVPRARARDRLRCRAAFTSIAQTERLTEKKVGVPVMALGGANGLGAKVGEMVGLVAESVNAVTLADSGHFLPEEAPDEVVRRVLAMAATVRTAQAGAESRGDIER